MCIATPEERDGYNVITITGNLPVPRAPENVDGFVRKTPLSSRLSLLPPPHAHTLMPKPARAHTSGHSGLA